MKKILNIINMETSEDVEKIREELSNTRLDFEISLQHKAVIIYGGPDEHRVAMLAIEKAGFELL